MIANNPDQKNKTQKSQISFRNWLLLIWQDNCSEHDAYNELPYTMEEYFHKYRWWLKREYRHQINRR